MDIIILHRYEIELSRLIINVAVTELTYPLCSASLRHQVTLQKEVELTHWPLEKVTVNLNM